jgi:hypothetical protein
MRTAFALEGWDEPRIGRDIGISLICRTLCFLLSKNFYVFYYTHFDIIEMNSWSSDPQLRPNKGALHLFQSFAPESLSGFLPARTQLVLVRRQSTLHKYPAASSSLQPNLPPIA